MKKTLMSILVCCVLIVGAFGLAGCGGVSVATIKENFETLNTFYAEHTDAFVSGTIEGIETNLKVDFGEVVNSYIHENKANYGELETLYNAALVISNDYINKNKEYIFRLEENEKSLSGEAKDALKELNSALTSYTKYVKTFVNERATFIKQMNKFAEDINDETNQVYLRRFKNTFGNLVESNVNLSLKLAETVDATEIFGLLQQVDALQSSDTGLVKEYVRAKMLPIFTEFQITEVANKMNWANQANGTHKGIITQLMNQVKAQYENYCNVFVAANNNYKTFTKEQLQEAFDMFEEFEIQSQAASKALKELDLHKLAVSYDNNMEKYLKTNPLAEVYLEKLQEFYTTILPNFVSAFSSTIFAD